MDILNPKVHEHIQLKPKKLVHNIKKNKSSEIKQRIARIHTKKHIKVICQKCDILRHLCKEIVQKELGG